MKKITLIVAILTICSFAFSQTKISASNDVALQGVVSPENNPKVNGKQVTNTPFASAKKVVGDTLFYEDFTGGFPSGWTFLDFNGSNFDWVICWWRHFFCN